MHDLKNEVLRVALERNIDAQVIPPVQASKLSIKLYKRFTKGEKYHYPLWEHLQCTKSLHDQEGWRKLNLFIGGKNDLVLFFEYKDSSTMIKFISARDIETVLSNSYAFVFYLTNMDGDFILCFNDHDYLIGVGSIIHKFPG